MNITKLVFLFLLLMSNGKVYSQDYTSGFDSNSQVFERLEFSKNDIAWSGMGNKLLPYRIIALGEPTHGSAEFATLRLSLTRQLILSKALTKIGLEIGFNNSDALNEYVNGQRSDIKEILKTLNFWPSRSVEFIDFLNWIKEYNYTKKPAEKIRLFGFDCTTRGNTNSKILSSIHSLGDKYLADSLIKEIDSFLVSRKPIKLIYQSLNSLENLVRKHYNTTKSSDVDSLEFGIKSVAYLKQIITSRAIPPEKVSYREFYRDSCMAENIQTAIAGNERVLIFTHTEVLLSWLKIVHCCGADTSVVTSS
ncbi:erythromycin esterase family protein [Pedobacter sp. BMA]|uniref:erythromycin esterase family protein n=1 Tax=Pedobacter sp. BMA TaxID=1663685 RepID=UPI00064B723A|nr:erythromycin esterase family protein [Pedobacter sp. BMA]KLT64718.1 hypothetical protein AB669_13275 [Pedobacter sp. BMA]